MKVQVCDAEGAVLSGQDAARSDDLIMPARSGPAGATVRLMRYGRLIDMIVMP
jgi:hypothetical protein